MRVDFCLQIHNEAVKAMRYPPESWKQTKEEDGASSELNEEDLAKLLAEDEDTD